MNLFIRVVEEGSFSAAARHFGNTPSSVSRQVSQLEHDLGTRLFNRTTRKQNLTEAGEVFYQHACRIIADAKAAQLAVSRLTDTPSGTLHVTVEEDFAVAFVAPILPDFLNKYPEVNLRISMNAGVLDLIDAGVDIAIRFGHLSDSSQVARKIATSQSLIVASPAYLKTNGTPRHPSDLKVHNCLSFRTGSAKNQWRFSTPQGTLDVPISGPVNVNSLTFLRDSALASVGIIMLPTWMMRDDLQNARLVPLLAGFPLIPPSTPIHAVFAHNRHLAPKVRAFVDFLGERTKVL